MYNAPKTFTVIGLDLDTEPNGGGRNSQSVQPDAGIVGGILPFRGYDTPSYIERYPWVETNCRGCGLHLDQLCTCNVRTLVLYPGGNIYRSDQSGVDCAYHPENPQKSTAKGDKTMNEFDLGDIIGTVFYTLVVFGLGALSGKKIWYWVRAFFPWNKD